MATQLTKSQLIEKIATENEIAKKDVKGVLETLARITGSLAGRARAPGGDEALVSS